MLPSFNFFQLFNPDETSTVTDPFPTETHLSGTDYFLVAMDSMMRSQGDTGNVCYFRMTVGGTIDTTLISKRIESSGLLSWLTAARLCQRLPFQIPKWKSGEEDVTYYIKDQSSFNCAHIPSSVSSRKISLINSPLFAIDVFHDGNNASILILSWHHSLMDAHGAEMFIKLLGMNDLELNPNQFFPKETDFKERFIDKLNYAKIIRQHMKEKTSLPFANLSGNSSLLTGKTWYRLIRFTLDETDKIDGTANRVGANFRKSALYLAASVRALFQVLKKRGPVNGDFVVPVPQDQRRRGAFGPVISNHVTFLFYRIPQEALIDLTSAVSCIVTQMKEIVRSEIHKCYSSFMDLCRRLPLQLYVKLLKSPTKGHIASFFFSDTGELFDKVNEFLKIPILDAVHYPPNVCPPGFTIIFSRFHGELQATISYSKEYISEDEVALFEHFFRLDFQGENKE